MTEGFALLMFKTFEINDSRILVAGGSGLVGGAVVRALQGRSCNVISPRRCDLDLRNFDDTRRFFATERPNAAILAAAKVGGIAANMEQPYEFLVENTAIQTNFMVAAHEVGVERLVFLGSSCIYPRLAEQPMPETALMSGPLEPTNTAYATAKLAGMELVKALRYQHKHKWISVLPCNLYGPGDNFNPRSSHVVPGLLKRFHEAKEAGASRAVLWGTGTVRREFLHASDAANGILCALEVYDDDLPLNIGSGSDVSIADLATMVADVVGFEGEIQWDPSKPEGVPRKLLNSSRMNELGWKPQTSLKVGLRETYDWMLRNMGSIRV